jgi:hypothetical protein
VALNKPQKHEKEEAVKQRVEQILESRAREEPRWDVSVIQSEDASLNYSLHSDEGSRFLKKKPAVMGSIIKEEVELEKDSAMVRH